MSDSLYFRSGSAVRGPLGTFICVCLVGCLVILATAHDALGFGAALSSILPVLAGFLVASAVAAYGLHTYYPHDRLGLCNVATFARLVIVAVLVIAILERQSPDTVLLGLAIFSLCLDGADGYLARRQGLVSGFGARFDVEVDAGFALTLAVFAAVSAAASPAVILLGLPYYVFGAARHVWPWLASQLPDSFARKAVCVAQIGVLIALLVPGIPTVAMDLAVFAVIGALIWSFGRDILWLYRGRNDL